MSAPERRRHVPVWVTVLLVISLSLNVLVVGSVGGLILQGGRDRGDGDRRPISTLRSLGLGPLVFALERGDRGSLADAMAERQQEVRPAEAALRASTRDLIAALRADPFQPDAVEAALAAQRGAVGDLQALGHDILLQHMTDADPRTRARVADRIERHLNRRGPEGR